ncbi:helix-turn-helix domain-containing protein [Asanoa iriomotensis]|uniref:helix-turn-helix domain-containing protein n=1 Tax=Asanoa iriomotensis TaxID=234613 RepID=UPI001944E11F|nr:helix-turn-helix domain-containing protein [Asanoa iriomotensis]
MSTNDDSRVVLTIEEAARQLGVGRTTMYGLVSAGAIRSITIGRLRRIPARCLAEYVDALLTESDDLPSAA